MAVAFSNFMVVHYVYGHGMIPAVCQGIQALKYDRLMTSSRGRWIVDGLDTPFEFRGVGGLSFQYQFK